MKFLKWLFGWKSNQELWQECVEDEALSRGLEVTYRLGQDGTVAGYILSDPSGSHKPMRFAKRN